MEPVKIYSDKSLWDTQIRKRFMMPLVRAHWDELSPDDRMKKYGNRATVSEMVDTIDEADVCSLPMIWNYYVERKQVGRVEGFFEQARAAGKNVIVWAEGDFEKIIPFSNALNFQQGLHRSYRRNNTASYAIPAFFEDYSKIYANEAPEYREKQAKARVGFCGQAAAKLPVAGVWLLRVMKMRLLLRLGRAVDVPPPLRPPWLLRAEALQVLAQSPLVETDFIIRDRYRAGVRAKDEHADPLHPTKVEFVRNIMNTDYTVCVRGGGNFSKRLYETLCCGRIPIFIDTESRLPYDFALDWKDYCVWVDQRDVPRLPEIVADFHARLSPKKFAETQRRCRRLWEERLTVEGYFDHFAEHISATNTA